MPLSLFALLFVGWGMVIQFALSNTVIQTLVDNDKRGRVMSLFTTALMGMGPFGSLLGGALAHKIGAPATVAICGLATLAGGIFFALKLSALQQFIIPIYQARGIIPQTDPGLGDVSDLPNLP